MTKEVLDGIDEFKLKFVSRELKETMEKANKAPEKDQKVEILPSQELNRIIIPSSMDPLQAAYNLLRQFKEENTTRLFTREYQHFFLNDFFMAFKKLVPEFFGMLQISPVDVTGRPSAPVYIDFPVAYEDGKLVTDKGFSGSIVADCWDGAIITVKPGTLIINAKLKHEARVTQFLDAMQAWMIHSSSIKGRSVEVKVLDIGLIAEPIDARINPNIVLSQSTERVISNILIPSLEDKGKTSLLLTGDFGVGKTECAIRLGIEGQKRYGRTFFYLKNSDVFSSLIPYIKNYNHCIVFVEDLDQVTEGDRDTSMNDLLNQLDGQELKKVDCTFIFTTNTPDKIHPAMRRPGRIDQVVHFGYCDKYMISKIFEIYSEGRTFEGDVDFGKLADEAIKLSSELQGAVVAEISRRAIKYCDKMDGGVVSEGRFLDAISSMEHHIKFMKDDQVKDESVEFALGRVIKTALVKSYPEFAERASTNDFCGA